MQVDMDKELNKIEREVKKEKGALVFDVKDMVPKVVKFCEAISGITFYPYQREYASGIIESLLLNDGEELTALFSRQSGKSETNACVIAGCLVILPLLAKLFPDYEPLQTYANGLWVGIFAPSGGQADTTFGRTKTRIKSQNAEMILADDDIDLDLKTVASYIALSNGSFCTAMSGSKTAYIESKTYHLIVIEEAQDVDNRVVRKSIHPMGASTNATIVKVGTANDKKSDFWEAINRNRRRNLNSNGRRYHFQYDYKEVQKYNPRYAKFIEKEKERLGVNSDEFRMAYGCEFILERGMFIVEEKFNELCALVPKLELRTSFGGLHKLISVGIDNAKRTDSTVVTVVEMDMDKPVKIDEYTGELYYQKRILDWLEIHGDDYESQFYQIVDFLKDFNPDVIVIDSTGSGDPVADRFKHYYYDAGVEVIPWVFSAPSKDRIYRYLQQEINNNRLEIPNGSRVERLKKWQKFKYQLLDLEKTWVGKYMVCKHPNEKDAKDDYPDSLALAVFGTSREGMPEIEVEENTFYDRQGRYKPLGWKRRTPLFG